MILWSGAQPNKWKQNGLKAPGTNRVWEFEWISAVCVPSGKGERREGQIVSACFCIQMRACKLMRSMAFLCEGWGSQEAILTGCCEDKNPAQSWTHSRSSQDHSLPSPLSVPSSWLVKGWSKCRYAHRFRGSSLPAKVEGLDFWFGFSVFSSLHWRLPVALPAAASCIPVSTPILMFVALPPVGTFWIFARNTGKLIETKEMLGLEWPYCYRLSGNFCRPPVEGMWVLLLLLSSVLCSWSLMDLSE